MKNFFIGLCVAGMLSPVGMSAAGGDIEMERFISSLLEKMTLEEKVGQLSQRSGGFATGPDNTQISRTEEVGKGLLGSMLNVCGVKETRKFQEAAMKSRLKIPMLFGMDVIHGFRTGFPLPLAEAASFDLEAIKMGANFIFGANISIAEATKGNGMIMVSFVGTAVQTEDKLDSLNNYNEMLQEKNRLDLLPEITIAGDEEEYKRKTAIVS